MTDQSRTITRKSASNLALAFVLLPIRLACDGGAPSFPVNRELQAVITQYRLPYAHFDELIRGVEMDLDTKRYQTFEELEQYCYRVASVVGLLSVEIFGYQNPACRQYAVYLGQALQLTNILRDVRNDAERGRIYFPLAELARCQVAPEEILRLEYSGRFAQAAAGVAARARHFYSLAGRTLPAVDRRSMIAAELMGSVYWRLLCELEGRRYDVFGPHPARLSRAEKIRLVLRTWWRLKAGAARPNYGTT